MTPVEKLAYDILTVQPMCLYPDDIEYLRLHYPQYLEDVDVGPHLANGWLLVRGGCCNVDASKAVCEYRKVKLLPETIYHDIQ